MVGSRSRSERRSRSITIRSEEARPSATTRCELERSERVAVCSIDIIDSSCDTVSGQVFRSKPHRRDASSTSAGEVEIRGQIPSDRYCMISKSDSKAFFPVKSWYSISPSPQISTLFVYDGTEGSENRISGAR
jgi:hypothetical protein